MIFHDNRYIQPCVLIFNLITCAISLVLSYHYLTAGQIFLIYGLTPIVCLGPFFFQRRRDLSRPSADRMAHVIAVVLGLGVFSSFFWTNWKNLAFGNTFFWSLLLLYLFSGELLSAFLGVNERRENR